VKNLVLLMGNHDHWALDWFLTGHSQSLWVSQGGNITINSYRRGIPARHVELLQQAVLYHVLDKKLFVHGGYQPFRDIGSQERELLLWDRSLVKTALQLKSKGEETHITEYDEVYVGHTPTLNFGSTEPIRACEVFMMDTGAGWPGGVLTMMDIDSKEFFQSDEVNSLYTK
jgi:serine/threonine protein phosphatase 1